MTTGYPSIDKPWLKYYPEGAADAEVPDMSIYQMLVQGKEDMLDQPAMSYLGRRISYGEYFNKIEEYAKSLKTFGVKPDEFVMLILPNIPECRELIYAVNYVGATAYPVNPLMPSVQISEFIARNSVRVVFVYEGFLPKFGSAFDAVDVLSVVTIQGAESAPIALRAASMLKRFDNRIRYRKDIVTPTISLSAFKRLGNGVEGYSPYYRRDHIAAIIGTSGTTGTPKSVCLTDENLNAHAVQHAVGLDSHPGEKLMDVIIPALAYGLCVMHYSGVLGLEAVVVPDFPTDVSGLLVKHKPEHFTGGPVHFEGLARLDAKARKALPRAKNMCSGGTSLPSWVESSLNKVEIGFVEQSESEMIYVRPGYGCSENCGGCTYAKKGSYKFGGVGIPLPLQTMGVFELGSDHEVGFGEQGEICVTGPTVMTGYLNNPAETESVLVAHGDGRVWLHTKDIGYVDEDGHFFLVDRAKNIFARLGHNVHPVKVADFITLIDGVDGCVVAGFPHPADGFVPVAFVKTDADAEVSAAELNELRHLILDSCFNGLEETSIPHDIVFVNGIPMNMGGKPDLQRLMSSADFDYESHPDPYGLAEVIDIEGARNV